MSEHTPTTIYDALKAANLEFSAFSSNGVNIYGDNKSITAAASAFHSHSQMDEMRTQIRHWREECGKAHARIAINTELNEAKIDALTKALRDIAELADLCMQQDSFDQQDASAIQDACRAALSLHTEQEGGGRG